MRSGIVLGLAFSAAGLAMAWEYVERTSTSPRLAAAAVAGFGILWAILVFLTFDVFLQRQLSSVLPRLNEKVYDRVALLSTTLALAGSTSGVLMGVQSLGAVGGTLMALAATLALGSVVPVVISLNVAPEEE